MSGVDFNVIAELDSSATDEATTDGILDALRGYSPAIGWVDNGHMHVTITVNAEDLAAAVSEGIRAVHRAAQAEVVHVEGLTTAAFDARVLAS
jgi:hypothetical protein